MRDEELCLRDIVGAASAIDRFLTGMSEDQWIDDEVRQSAVMHQLIIIGEAASRLPREFREANPQIAWADIVTPLKELNYGVMAQGSWLGIGHERSWNQRNSRCMGVSSLPRKGCAPG